MIAHTDLQILWIICLVLSLSSTTLYSSPQYPYYGNTLPCKTYNKDIVDCKERHLVNVPTLDSNLVTSLDMSHNLLSEITEAPFTKLKELSDLNLNFNEITRLSVTAFRGLYSLRYLNLNYNYLTDLPNYVFADLSNLIHLDLVGNQFKAIPNQALSLLHSLQYLSFSPTGFEFSEIDLSGLRNLSNLEKVHLSVTNLQTDITSDTLQQLSSSQLQSLYFVWTWKSNHNTIDRETFASLANLTSLTTSFLALPALQSVHLPLYHLELHCKQVKLVVNITTLQVLRKFNSTLTHLTLAFDLPVEQLIDDYSFIWTPNLINLDLRRNHINHLTKHAFYGLKSLQKLILCYNLLTEVPSDALEVFRKSATLQHLDLSFNSISNIPQNAFSAVISTLTYLNIYNNFLASPFPAKWFNSFQILNHISLKDSKV